MVSKYKYKILIGIFIMGLLFTSSYGGEEKSLPPTLRVGLVTYYKHLDVLSIYNHTVIPGFYMNDTFFAESTLSTAGQAFSFRPTTKLYLESEQTFATYEPVVEKVSVLRQAGYKAYATLLAHQTWKVFVGNVTSQLKLDELHTQVNNKNGLTYIKAPMSQERIMMETEDNYPVLFENRYGYTNFSTADKKGTDTVLDLGKRSYRGYIEVARYGSNQLSVVNQVGIDAYLNSVVVSEIYAAWPEESLKAQAVAARTFAVYHTTVARKYPNDPYDLNDTVGSQVYKGYEVEDSRVNAAVTATSGELIYYEGQVIPAYFFASSGGRTENSENVWVGAVPYLKSVPDIYEQEPERYPWTQTYTPSEIKDKLAKRGVNIGEIKDLIATVYTNAGRVMTLTVVGTQGTYDLKKETMRYWLGIYSRKFQIIRSGFRPDTTYAVLNGAGINGTINYNGAFAIKGDGVAVSLLDGKEQVVIMGTENMLNQPMISGVQGKFILAGSGWGHGVGMSQAGAKGMAKEGYTYKEILAHYYTGVTIW